MALVGSKFTAALLFLPAAVLILSVFVLGLSYLFAAANVFLRDFAFMWTTVSFLWFVCSPIMYPMEAIAPENQKYFEMNPLLPLIRLFQDPMGKGVLPQPETILLACVYAAVTFVLGTSIFARSQRSFYSYL
jgi:ABC-type polysaccharide/polyol phosphate export permease